jgi:hypothetical protein
MAMLSPRRASVNRFRWGGASTLDGTEREARLRVLACYAGCADEASALPAKLVDLARQTCTATTSGRHTSTRAGFNLLKIMVGRRVDLRRVNPGGRA